MRRLQMLLLPVLLTLPKDGITGVEDHPLVEGIAYGEGGGFGRTLHSRADFNGDGHFDVVSGQMVEGDHVYDGQVVLIWGDGQRFSTENFSVLSSPDIGFLDKFGESVTAADVNGDGYDDLVVGAPLSDGSDFDQGKLFVYFGSAAGLPVQPDEVIRNDGGDRYAMMGESLSAADVNGDGYADVIVGQRGVGTGDAWVVYGSVQGLLLDSTLEPTIGTLVAPTFTFSSAHGETVLGAGDIDGDGYDDVLVGGEGDGVGYVALYLGGLGTPLLPTDVVMAPSGAANSSFGEVLADGGDLNSDGFDDVIVGAVDESAVYVLFGEQGGFSDAELMVQPMDIDVWTSFGQSIVGNGDINGDGYDDFVVSRLGDDNLYGCASVYFGSPTGLDQTTEWNLYPGDLSTNGTFKGSVGALWDLDADGLDDVMVGMYRINTVTLFYGVESEDTDVPSDTGAPVDTDDTAVDEDTDTTPHDDSDSPEDPDSSDVEDKPPGCSCGVTGVGSGWTMAYIVALLMLRRFRVRQVAS